MKQGSSGNPVKHGVVAQACDATIQKPEAGGSGVQCQPGLPTETLSQNPEAARKRWEWRNRGAGQALDPVLALSKGRTET